MVMMMIIIIIIFIMIVNIIISVTIIIIIIIIIIVIFLVCIASSLQAANMAEGELTLVKAFDLGRETESVGMAILSCDSVALGNAGGGGSSTYFVSGESTLHLTTDAHDVLDLARLSDGRVAVSNGVDVVAIYNADSSWGRKFMSLSNFSTCCSIDADANDNIYVVNRSNGVYHFQPKTYRPYRVISTGDMRPTQICATVVGTLIASDNNTIAVYGTDGARGSSIQTSDDGEKMYAAVYSPAENIGERATRPDTVFVARVRIGSNVLRLTAYTLEGTTLTETKNFKELEFPEKVGLNSCMVCLQPDLVAFASGKKLYFVQAPM